MIDKALLTGAFEKMGSLRVTEMLRAFGPEGLWDDYCKCALGFAAGFGHRSAEERWDAMEAAGFGFATASRGENRAVGFLAQQLGLTLAEAEYIETVHMFGTWPFGKLYGQQSDYRAEAQSLVALANEWLENRPASLRAATRETEVLVGVGAGPTTETPQP